MIIDKELLEALLEAPDTQMDEKLVEVVRGWNGEASALEILKALDDIVYYSWGSEFVVFLFKTILDVALEEEGITYEDIIKLREER